MADEIKALGQLRHRGIVDVQMADKLVAIIEESIVTEHKFGSDSRCVRCGMRSGYFAEGESAIRQWPDGKERRDRLAELRSCKPQ